MKVDFVKKEVIKNHLKTIRAYRELLDYLESDLKSDNEMEAVSASICIDALCIFLKNDDGFSRVTREIRDQFAKQIEDHVRKTMMN